MWWGLHRGHLAVLLLGAVAATWYATLPPLPLPPPTATARSHELRLLAEIGRREGQLDAFWRDHGAEGATLRRAVEGARRAVVRVRVFSGRRVGSVQAWTRVSLGSGVLLDEGRLLLLTAHQGSGLFAGPADGVRISFATWDGRVLSASVVAVGGPLEDWTLCRVHNPFELELDALEFAERPPAGLIAALGYPAPPVVGGFVGLEPAELRPQILPVPPGLHARWPEAYPVALVGRVGGSLPSDLLWLAGQDVRGGMSGGPVVDATGRVVGVARAYRLDSVETGEGATVPNQQILTAAWTDGLRSAVHAITSRPESPACRLARRVASVLMGHFAARDAPVESRLTRAEIEKFGLGLDQAQVDALVEDGVVGMGSTAGDDAIEEALAGSGRKMTHSSFATSSFQASRWFEARLRELQELGPAAVAEFREVLEAELAAASDAPFRRDDLRKACEQTGVDLGLGE